MLYTDGISEARVDRPLPAATIADALQRVLADRAAGDRAARGELVEEHAGGPPRDEVAVLVLRQTKR